MIRLVLVVLFAVIFLILGCIPALIFFLEKKLTKKTSFCDRASRTLVRFAFRSILFLSGTKLTVDGKEKIPADRAVLYVGNHRSYFDIIISYLLFPGQTGFIAKKEMLKVPLLSLWMRYIHCLFLDRSNIKEGFKTILAAIAQVNDGISVCIYPEGTRSKGESETDLLEFKEGSMKIAQKSGCPVVPIAILRSADILENHFPKIRATKIHVRIGDPIDLSSLDKEQKKFSGSYVREVIRGMLEDMKREEAESGRK